jgi:DNA-binding response OmpR family regulator
MNARPVLLIDTDTEWCAHVCRFLEPHGIEVMTAANVDAATAQLHHCPKPGAVVFDARARYENGRAIALLRRQPALSDVPVGYLKKTAALDALLLMLGSSAAGSGHCAA